MGVPVFKRTPRKWSAVNPHLQTPCQVQGAVNISHCIKKGTWIEGQSHSSTNRQHCSSTLPEQTGQLSFPESSPPFAALSFSPRVKNQLICGCFFHGKTFYGEEGSIYTGAHSFSQELWNSQGRPVCKSNNPSLLMVPDKNDEDKCWGTKRPQGRLEKVDIYLFPPPLT